VLGSIGSRTTHITHSLRLDGVLLVVKTSYSLLRASDTQHNQLLAEVEIVFWIMRPAERERYAGGDFSWCVTPDFYKVRGILRLIYVYHMTMCCLVYIVISFLRLGN
jgi:hypothetical protein